jgi:hypothetical protein
MTDLLGMPEGQPTRLPLSTIYLRIVAVLLLAAGLLRACLILGITPDGVTFTDLDPAWRGGATALAIVDLLAAVGLWVGAAWGPVMWAIAAIVEITMYTMLADVFGSYPRRVAAHGALFALYLVLLFVEWRREAAE